MNITYHKSCLAYVFFNVSHHLSILGGEYGWYQRRAIERQLSARAPGTIRNQRSGVYAYLAFCSRLGIDELNPTYEDVLTYIEYLAEHVGAPSTVKNKLSQVRVFINLAESKSTSFAHPRVQRAIDALEKHKTYTPRVKDPLDPYILYGIISNIATDPLGVTIRAAFLILYYGALRQSELLPRTVNSWSRYIQPTRGDCTLSQESCIITIKTGKNMQKVGQQQVINLIRASNPIICPVMTMHQVYSNTPTQQISEPLLMFPDTRKPLPSSLVVKELHSVMRYIGLADMIPRTSLHSLRKAAATNAFTGGCTETSIKNYGGWSSDAYTAYIRTSNQKVNISLIQSLDPLL